MKRIPRMKRHRHRNRAGDDRGSAAVELVIIAPLFGLMVLAVVAVGRVQNSRADIEAAARMAARELSIVRDPRSQLPSTRELVNTTLDVGSPSCRTMTLTANITNTRIDVTVSCNLQLQQAALLPLPGSMTVTAEATEIRDAYREATP